MRARPNLLWARVTARAEQAARDGAWKTAGWLFGLTASAVVWLALFPVTLLLHLAGFRRLTVLVGRIGHLAAEPDSFLKAWALGRVAAGRYFLLAPPRRVANATMLDYWRPHLPIIEQPMLCWIIAAMSRWLLMKHDMSRYVLKLNASQEIYKINAAWAERAPLLKPVSDDIEWSEKQFEALGLPRGAWFVCAHVREPGFSPADEAVHAHRNGDPRAITPAVAEIVRRGGWCVRVGDPTMTPMDPMEGLIDYAHHPLRSNRLDIMLCARARFFLGNTSGLALVSTAFGVPCALVNMIPLACLAPLAVDLTIPKLHRLEAASRFMAFDEILGAPVGDFRYAKLYADAGITVIENSPEEILDLVREMLDRLEGRYRETDEDSDLQRRFMRLLGPGHYSYGAVSRVGAAFLRKYRHLLPA